MRITAFLGSPRRRGNTERLLDAALRGVREAGGEVELFRIPALSIEPCRNCGGCAEKGRCVVRDGMGPVYEAIRNSDRLVLASPIYFFSLSAQAKILIDRCQAFWSEKYLLKRPIPPGPAGRRGLLLLVGAYRKAAEAVHCAEVCAGAFFRSVSVPDFETVSVLGPDAAGEIDAFPEGLEKARDAGFRLARTQERS